LAGPSALSAAKDVHAHVLAHGQDFMSNHDFARVLDRHAKNDYKHSTPEDTARAVRAGVINIHPHHLEMAQNEAAAKYQAANDERHALRSKRADGDSSKLTGDDRKKWDQLSSQVATHGDHIDTINTLLLRHRAGHEGILNEAHDALEERLHHARSDRDTMGDPAKAKAHADEVVEGLKAKHTPAELHALAKRVTGKKGKAKDGSDSLQLIHNDLTAVSRMVANRRA
jgi:hypothetical protein